ncbi:ribokinase [Saccharibacillus sp. CPCC 101409]|uniref:ribokinase n=1 Tax=Saccharibacillus sp. CPCC 101409 TaxID=3058041 RepID=UPI0026725698|nr:ribokinase [Saccharibacillus sp. CPCC 101409]MDO3413150.1 ribokinase [Saccharibacillus sp. CPCC 101409]
MTQKERPRIAVVGSLNMDVVMESGRVPQQGETVLGTGMHMLPGGKGANQAVCAARLGARVSMIGAVGADGFGEEMTAALEREGIDTSCVLRRGDTPSGTASIWLSGGDNRIVVFPGANGTLTAEDVSAPEPSRLLREADAVLIQLEIPLETAAEAASIARAGGAIVLLNPAPAADALPDALLRSASVLTPNRGELAILAGESAEGQARLIEAARKLAAASGGAVVTTLGGAGALVLESADREPEAVPAAYAGPVVDTTGAGDCFSAALAAALARGSAPGEAARYAACAAALAVTRLGAQGGMPTAIEVGGLYSASADSAGG